MRIRYNINPVAFRRRIEGMADPIKRAAAGAVFDAGNLLLSRGRTDIASAGFPGRWQTGLRVKFAKPGANFAGVAKVFHNIFFANVFERGAKISGKPLLWLPLPTAPTLNGHLMSVKDFIKAGGQVRSIVVRGKPPLLGGYMLGAANSRVTIAKLRSGGALARLGVRSGRSGAGRAISVVPLFVGVPTVQLRKRFNIAQIADEVRAQLPQLYAARVRGAA